MNDQRANAFRTEIAEIGIKDPATARERRLRSLGVAMMVIGLLIAVASYFGSNGTTNPLGQRDYIVLAIIGLTTSVIGVGLFLRYSLASFLRFWLARLIYEQQAQTDRLLDRNP